MDYVVHAGHQLRFTFSDASPYSLPAETGQVVTMSTGLSDGTSQVRVPETAYAPEAVVAELGDGVAGMGGPVTGVAVIIGVLGTVTHVVRRRRRRKEG